MSWPEQPAPPPAALGHARRGRTRLGAAAGRGQLRRRPAAARRKRRVPADRRSRHPGRRRSRSAPPHPVTGVDARRPTRAWSRRSPISSAEFAELDEDITPEQTDRAGGDLRRRGVPAIRRRGRRPRCGRSRPVVSGGPIPPAAVHRRQPQRFRRTRPARRCRRRFRIQRSPCGAPPAAARADGERRMSDLLLVDADSGDVVYSTHEADRFRHQRVHRAARVRRRRGPGPGSERCIDRLSGVAVGDAVISDTVFYVPDGGRSRLLPRRSGSDRVPTSSVPSSPRSPSRR